MREALFTSGSVKLGDVRPSVRSSVRSFVRIIIDFCQEDMEGDEALLDTGSLNYGFRVFRKKLKITFKNSD